MKFAVLTLSLALLVGTNTAYTKPEYTSQIGSKLGGFFSQKL